MGWGGGTVTHTSFLKNKKNIIKQAGAGAVPSSVQLSAKLSTMLISSVWN